MMSGMATSSMVFVSILIICIIFAIVYFIKNHKQQSDITDSSTFALNEENTGGMVMSPVRGGASHRKDVYLKVVVLEELTATNLQKLMDWFNANAEKRRTVVSVISHQLADYVAPVALNNPQVMSCTVRISDTLQLFILSNYWYRVHRRVQLDGFTINGGEKITLEIDPGAHLMLYSGTEPISTDNTYSTLCASINVTNIFNSTKLYWANNRISLDSFTASTTTSRAPDNAILNYITPNVGSPLESSDVMVPSEGWNHDTYITLYKLNKVSSENAVLMRKLISNMYQLTTKWPCLVILSPPYYTLVDMSHFLPVNVRLKRIIINSTLALSVLYRVDVCNREDRVSIASQYSKEFGLVASVVVREPIMINYRNDTLPLEPATFCQLAFVQNSPYSLVAAKEDKNVTPLFERLSLVLQPGVGGATTTTTTTPCIHTPIVYTSFGDSLDYPSKYSFAFNTRQDSMLVSNDSVSSSSQHTRLFDRIDPFNTSYGITIY